MPNGVASKDQMFLIDVYVFKYWQVLQPVQMSVGAIFDQDGNCVGFSRAVLGSRHVSVLKLPCRWREPPAQHRHSSNTPLASQRKAK